MYAAILVLLRVMIQICGPIFYLNSTFNSFRFLKFPHHCFSLDLCQHRG